MSHQGLNLENTQKEMLKIWESKISRKNWTMKPNHKLCERHFEPDDIIDSEEVTINGVKIITPMRKKLRPNAIPTRFSHKEPPKPKRKAPVERTPIEPCKKKKSNEVDPINMVEGDQSSITVKHNPAIEDNNHLVDNSPPDKVAETPLSVHGPMTFAETLHLEPQKVELPSSDWIIRNKKELAFVHCNDVYNNDKYITMKKNSNEANVFINSTLIPSLQQNVTDYDDLNHFLREINSKKVCSGTGFENIRAQNCSNVLDGLKPPPRCHNCFKKNKAIQRKNLRKRFKSDAGSDKRVKAIEKRKNAKRILKRKIARLETKLCNLMEEMSNLKEKKVEQILASLQPKQRLSVQACISAAKAKSSKGRRYTKEWMYECILMRFKGPALYRKMQQEDILPLPSPRTIQRYLKKMRPAYGFQHAIFGLLSKKGKEMADDERHGALLLDEMKLQEGVDFDKSTLKVIGLTNMDKYTPDELKDKPGDHALVLMFQPFKGTWLQTVAALLTRGAAKGRELAMIVLDAVTRLEQCRFHVDIISSDGASWNRTMWAEMGMIRTVNERELDVSEEDILSALEAEEEWETTLNLDFSAQHEVVDEFEVQVAEVEIQADIGTTTSKHKKENTKQGKKKTASKKKSKKKEAEEHRQNFVSVNHPCNEKRRLWFASDFPHLAKTIKERVLKMGTLKTPDGTVKSDHWTRLYQVDSKKGIRVVPKLCPDHFAKEGYLTMKVKLAYSFFSEEVAVGMEHYCKEGVAGLEDVTATVAFIRRINKLIDVMDANRPSTSLRVATGEQGTEAQDKEFVEEFLQFLQEWEALGVLRKFRLTSQTAFGLRVTLSAALQLTDYLSKQLGFDYFMTKRMSQDALEHFFGKVRQSCGAGAHPSPTQFIQVYRLLSVGSLIKPPRGTNITGAEMLDSLLKVEDIIDEENRQRRINFENELDRALDSGEIVDDIEMALGDHRYAKDLRLEEKALRYFTGYVARKARRASTAKTCDHCFSMLCAPDDYIVQELDDIIIARSKRNLIIPSDTLYKLVKTLETAVLETVKVRALTQNIIFTVLEHVKSKQLETVGCEEHKRKLTKDIVSFYLNTRLIFACEEYNRVQSDNVKQKRKSKQLVMHSSFMEV
ncbi:Transposable element P transposase [Frankliniella fusca]|uniref:Transposable element P transposase n=1 Tax=Frankliniella fusca TaxID=407009 RepID=A0AAE1GQF4_9NEOP|nr:Transposable element P transposase [Frankliniella fusca]